MFTEDWEKYVVSRSNIDPAIAKMSAIFMISAICGRNFYFDAPFTRIYPNIWSFVTGKSRISRKTTLYKYMKNAINDIDKNLFISDDFTPESFPDEFVENPHRIQIDDEAGAFLSSINESEGKQYMSGMKQRLCKFYDSDKYVRRRRTADDDGKRQTIIDNIYFCKFLMVQPSGIAYLTEADFEVGYLNRFMFLSIKPQERKDVDFLEYQPNDIKKIIPQLRVIHKISKLNDHISFIFFDEEVDKLWNEYDSKVHSTCESLPDNDLKIGYLANLPTTLIKLCMLFTLDDIKTTDVHEGVVIIEEDIMRKSIKYIDDVVMPNFNEFIVSFTKTRQEGRSYIVTHEKEIERLRVLIEYYQPVGIPELLRHTNLFEKELVEILESLLKRGDIERVKVKIDTNRGVTKYAIAGYSEVKK